MAVTLTKPPLSKLGKPLRPCDPVSAECLLGVHTGFPVKRGQFAYIDPCDGYTFRIGHMRHCYCNCHTPRKGN